MGYQYLNIALYIHFMYLTAIIREVSLIGLGEGREETNGRLNDIFAKFGRDKDKVTFLCSLGVRKGSHT